MHHLGVLTATEPRGKMPRQEDAPLRMIAGSLKSSREVRRSLSEVGRLMNTFFQISFSVLNHLMVVRNIMVYFQKYLLKKIQVTKGLRYDPALARTSQWT